MTNFLEKINGYKTYSGVLITVIALISKEYLTEDGATAIVNGAFQIVGILLTVVGAVHKDWKNK